MKRYLIKATITGGAHEGETYLMRKGGYVISDTSLYCADDCYKTEAAAKAVASKWNRQNAFYQYTGSVTIEPTKYEAVEVA